MHRLSYKPIKPEARATLLSTVFGAAPKAHGVDPQWFSAGFSDESGHCVASADMAVLSILLDGTISRIGAVRLVAVHPDWRGRGLFRDMMMRALAWCDERTSGLTALYAEQPDLYGRFGFEPVPQHAFVGPAPRPKMRADARTLAWPSDKPTIGRSLAGRCAVSSQCAVIEAPALFMDALEADASIALAYLEAFDALVAYETDDTTLVLIDVVAATIPPLASILGALGRSFDTVRTLFPPDKLAWAGDPVADDTGLMLRGPLPAAMTRPFMLPPTTGF